MSDRVMAIADDAWCYEGLWFGERKKVRMADGPDESTG